MRKHLWALLAVAFVFIAPATANAACTATGNTSGTDSAAALANLYQMCNAGISTSQPNSVGANGSAAKTSSDLVGVSDGTNQQQVVAPIGLADGVNGNNSVSVGGYVWNGATWDRMPGTTAGVTVKPFAATTSYNGNVTSTKVAANASATKVRGYSIANNNSAMCYLQLFNAASANVTVGSTAPTWFVAIPANGAANMPISWNFSTAMTLASTTTYNGSTNCTNGLDVSLTQD